MGKALCSRTATKDEKVRKARKVDVVEAEKEGRQGSMRDECEDECGMLVHQPIFLQDMNATKHIRGGGTENGIKKLCGSFSL